MTTVAMQPDATAEFDVLASGLLFYDLVFSSLPDAGPQPGREIWTRDFGHGPGGIANFAITCARLGLSTTLAASIGDDRFGALCLLDLEREGIDLSRSAVHPNWPTPVTAALGYKGDRALVTAGGKPPIGGDELLAKGLPRARAAILHIGAEEPSWLAEAASQGCKVFADVGWDPTGRWDPSILDQLRHCHAFVPNEVEAMHYTGTKTAKDAARRLSERTTLTVVTRGGDGVIGIDAGTGEYAEIPALRIDPVDTTGAGDIFGAALIFARLRVERLDDQLRFAVLVAGLAVALPGGAATAPRPVDLLAWYSQTKDPAYAFLPGVLADTHPIATITAR